MALIAFLIVAFLVIGLRSKAAEGSSWAEPQAKAIWASVALIALGTAFLLFSWAAQTG